MSQKSAKRGRKKAGRLPAPSLPTGVIHPDNVNGRPLEQKVQTTLPKLSCKVPGDLAQLILNYLSTKPFQEVHQLISGLMQCEKMKE